MIEDTSPARMPGRRSADRRSALYADVATRAKPGFVPTIAPEIRRGLFYTDEGWRVREYGIIAQRDLSCWHCGSRIYLKRRPKEGVHPCTTKLLLDRKRECHAGVYLLSVRPGWLWFMDVAVHEEVLIDLMTYDEILEWFEVAYQRLRPTVRSAVLHQQLMHAGG